MRKAEGIILKGVGGNYVVDCDGTVYPECKASGRLRLGERIPVCGDRVELEIDPRDDSGYIVSLLERRNGLMRPAIANIDRLFILAGEAQPKTDPYLIDKLTVLAAWEDIEPVIVLSKSDLDQSDGLFETYTAAGFEVVRVSAVSGEGLDALEALLAHKISAFTGNSGIGKSSVLNQLDGRFAQAVGDISRKIGRGKNTTRHTELLRLRCGGLVADTPGFSSFDIAQMTYIPKGQLAALFPEIVAIHGGCRFSNCAHVREPGCAFLEKVRAQPALKSRHESYVKLYDELGQIHVWELGKK